MSKGLSLHIGVNRVDPTHYQGWSGPLVACEADAESMEAIATQVGYSHGRLLTEAATRDSVIAGIRSAAQTLEGGDIFFLSYAGHGGRVPDTSNDEPDLKDETWCLFDGQLIDDELGELWAEFRPGVRILLLSDSCHSGSVDRGVYEAAAARGEFDDAVRGPQLKTPEFRGMPDAAAFRTYKANKEFYKAIAATLPAEPSAIKATVRLISGCQDDQLSADGTFNGLFTGTLLRVWNEGRFEDDYAKFHEDIVNRMPDKQTPNHSVRGGENPDFDAEKPFSIAVHAATEH